MNEIDELRKEVRRMSADLKLTLETMNSILTGVATIVSKLAPVLDESSNSCNEEGDLCPKCLDLPMYN